jgi:hypothetical protein
VFCRFVVCRWCLASAAWIPSGWLIAFGRRHQTLRLRIQLKVLWPGTQKHKGLDGLVPFHLREGRGGLRKGSKGIRILFETRAMQSF